MIQFRLQQVVVNGADLGAVSVRREGSNQQSDVWISVSVSDAAMLVHYVGQLVRVSVYPEQEPVQLAIRPVPAPEPKP